MSAPDSRTDQDIQTYTIAVINALFLKAPEEKRQVGPAFLRVSTDWCSPAHLSLFCALNAQNQPIGGSPPNCRRGVRGMRCLVNSERFSRIQHTCLQTGKRLRDAPVRARRLISAGLTGESVGSRLCVF